MQVIFQFGVWQGWGGERDFQPMSSIPLVYTFMILCSLMLLIFSHKTIQEEQYYSLHYLTNHHLQTSCFSCSCIGMQWIELVYGVHLQFHYRKILPNYWAPSRKFGCLSLFRCISFPWINIFGNFSSRNTWEIIARYWGIF